jgi:hypothetical protein
MTHTELAAALQSFERAESLAAQESAEKAEALKAEKQRTMTYQTGMPDSRRVMLEDRYDRDIAHHERQAKIHRRRGEYAASGYLLSGPDEATDAAYHHHHGDLIRAMGAAGRIRHTEERTPD